MGIAQHAREFPSLARSFPDHRELHHSAVLFSILLMAEAMFAYLNCAVARHRINLESLFQELAAQVGHIVEYLHEILLCPRIILQPAAIVVELEIGGEQRHQTFQIMSIEGIEHQAIHASDALE